MYFRYTSLTHECEVQIRIHRVHVLESEGLRAKPTAMTIVILALYTHPITMDQGSVEKTAVMINTSIKVRHEEVGHVLWS